MAKNPDNKHTNRHRVFVGASGSGKTSAVKAIILDEKPPRLLIWDPYEDHEGQRCTTRAEFAAAARAAEQQDSFRILLTVNPTREAFEWWCAVVFAMADGNKPLLAIAEEIADVTTVAKASAQWGKLIRTSRKYGVRVWATTQRPAECDKTILTQAAIKWAGRVEPHDARSVARIVGKDDTDIIGLAPLEFYERSNGETRRGKVNRKGKRFSMSYL